MMIKTGSLKHSTNERHILLNQKILLKKDFNKTAVNELANYYN